MGNVAVQRVTVLLCVLLALWNAHVEPAAYIVGNFVAFLSDSTLLSEHKLTTGQYRCLPQNLKFWSLKLIYEQLPVARSTWWLNSYVVVWYLWILSTLRALCHLFDAWSFEVASEFLEKLWSALCERSSLYPFERPVSEVREREISQFNELDRTHKHECTVRAKCRSFLIKILVLIVTNALLIWTVSY
jgi:hypothetical protein